jgi:hypothetical protein
VHVRCCQCCSHTLLAPLSSNRLPAKTAFRQNRFLPKSPQGKASAAADKKDAEEPADGLDVYLTLINGVVGRSKELKYDNGALQYFFGVPPTTGDYAKDASAQSYSGQVSAWVQVC